VSDTATGTATIVALTDDLMVGTRIDGTLAAAGYAVQIVGDSNALLAAAQAGASAVVVSFGGRTGEGVAAIRALRANAATATLPILAFGPHVDMTARTAARDAGATRVTTNGAFFTRMPAIVVALLAGESPPATDDEEA